MYVPSFVRAFGSAFKIFQIQTTGLTRRFYKNLEVKRTRKKYMDKPHDRCTNDPTPNLTACIANYIAGQIGCSINIQGVQPTNKSPCNTTSQLKAFAATSAKLENAEATTIYAMTGCLSACEKDKFDLTLEREYYKTLYGSVRRSQVLLQLTIHERSHIEEEEYIIYDSNNLLAEIGGFLGLILGSSMLSLYDVVSERIKKVKWGIKDLVCID